MSKEFKPLGFAKWVNKYGEQLCDLYDDWIELTGTDKFDVSILDYEEREYRKSKHYLYTEEIDCDVMNILVANGGVA